MKILVFDNYDSFTYNLVHALRSISDAQIDVVRNDKLPLEKAAAYDKIVLSPGPGIPSEAGLLLDLIRQYASSKNILGVCLGHQALCEAFGASLINLSDVHHGLSEEIRITAKDPLFEGLPERFDVGRYHSWAVSPEGFPDCLEVTAVDAEGQIMAMQHRNYPIHGVQFHPESVLTPYGKEILQNWIRL
jgi:anthranilate synthase component 2